MRKSLTALALCLLAARAAGTDPAPAGGEFTATATVESKQGTRSMAFSVSVSNPRSPEQVLPLQKVLEEGGQQALLNVIRGGSGGQLKLGALAYPVDLSIAEPVKGGERYLLVLTRPLRIEEVNEGQPSLDFPFTVIAFEVPEFGRGEGKIAVRAALSVEADGHVRVDTYDAPIGKLKDVHRTK